MIAQGRYVEAERVARAAVRILEQGDAYSPLAEALTTHGTALVRLGNYERSRETLQRAIEIAHNAGIYDDAGQAALTMIEELGERLPHEEMQTLYDRADQWLAETQHPQTIRRLRQAARQIMDAGRMREGQGSRKNSPARLHPCFGTDSQDSEQRAAHRHHCFTGADYW